HISRPPAVLVLSAGVVVPFLFAAALVVYCTWRRSRYFGNTAPLLVLVLVGGANLIVPTQVAFAQHAMVFAFVFIAGIMADLLETSRRKWILTALLALLVLNGAATVLFMRGWT